MLVAVAIILFVLWLLGLIAHVGSDLIHFLLIASVVVLLYKVVDKP
jgi:hypothetical protein